VRSLAMQPIDSPNPIGAIGVYWRRKHRPGEEQLELLAKLAGIAAILLDNVRLRRPPLRIGAEGRVQSANDELLAIVSHELRSPLGAILGWAKILRNQPDPAVVALAADVIERSAETQARLIEDLLDFSRIASGKLRIERTAVDLSLLLRQVVEAVQPAAKQSNIEIEIDTEPTLPLVLADRTRLQQVVWNLLTNAMKFTLPGGRISVRARCSGRNARIEVIDTGIGIAPELLPYVFEPYRQGPAEARRGLGLGLAISRDIVALHLGTLEAHSDGVGRGARFIVTLPLQQG
jgi:signal transduction histidine kinase